MKPLVSICCITYNQEKFIDEALNGFLIQETKFPIEILIHDDASTDNTPFILKKYEEKDQRIKVIYQNENKYSMGEKPLIKYLFPKAKGKYIAICEGDDFWTDPYKLQKQVDFLENKNNHEFILCFHDVMLFDENKKQRLKVMNNGEKDLSQLDLIIQPNLHLSSVMFKNLKDIIRRIYDVDVYNGDTLLYNALGHHGKAKYLEDVSYNVYRLHGNGVWAGKDLLTKSKHSLGTYEYLSENSNAKFKRVLQTKVLKKRIMYALALHYNNEYKKFTKESRIILLESFKYKQYKELGYFMKQLLTKN